MASRYLHYAVLGHPSFEVLPCYISDYESHHGNVNRVLEDVCLVWGVPHQRSYLWLVCNITTVKRWAKRRLTFFIVENPDPL